jgi:hypothetical protein
MALFETKSERHERLHNEGEKAASESESTLLGETKGMLPYFGWGETESEDNEAWKAGFDNGVKMRDQK